MNNFGLDYGAIYRQLIDFSTEELTKYQEVIESFLRQEKFVITSRFDEIKGLVNEDEEYYDFLVGSLSEEYHNFDSYYPNSFRASIIIQSYSFLEYHLKRICNYIYYSQNLKFNLHDLKGSSDIEKPKVFLKRLCNINFGDFNPDWEFINKVRIFRNTIVHSSGEFEIKATKLVEFIREHSSLAVRDHEEEFNKALDRSYEVIIVDEKLNLEFIAQIKGFFEKLTKEVFKRQ